MLVLAIKEMMIDSLNPGDLFDRSLDGKTI